MGYPTEPGRIKFDIGQLRQKVTLQANTPVRGATGQSKPAWSDVGAYRARVENLTGRALVNAAQLKNTVTHKVTMRVVGPITAKANRLLFEGRAFNIEVVYRVENRNAFYELWCCEDAGK